jgi:hypothetical protein
MTAMQSRISNNKMEGVKWVVVMGTGMNWLTVGLNVKLP